MKATLNGKKGNMNNIRMFLTFISLCFFSFTGRAQDIRISEIGYDSVRTRFYVTLENHIDGIISILPDKPDFVENLYNRDKNYKNFTYAAYRMKDKDGTVIESSDRRWLIQGEDYNYFVFSKNEVTGDYPPEKRTFFFGLEYIPARACSIEVEFYVKIFRLGVLRDQYVLSNPHDGYIRREYGNLKSKPYYEKKISKTFKL